MTTEKPKPEVLKVLDEFAYRMNRPTWKAFRDCDVEDRFIRKAIEELATLAHTRGYEQGKLDLVELLNKEIPKRQDLVHYYGWVDCHDWLKSQIKEVD
jgi:hypothetical protein